VTERKSTRLRWLIRAGILIAFLIAVTVVSLGIGQWLIVEDPLAHADAIVIFSGRLPERALEASRLFLAGYSDRLLISQPTSPAEELKKMNIFYLGEDFYNEKVLLAQGIPLDAIQIMENPISNTEEEVQEICDTLKRNGSHSAILVTSKPHTRRVRTIWRRRSCPDLQGIVRYVSDEPYDGAHWWRHTRDAADVLHETLGLLNAWAGFPLRPSKY
jgi:uncharacterized SAM-binding protein YcdF (DUF218 family)